MSPEATQQLTQNLTDITSWIKSSLEAGGKFAAEQTPIYVHELISWEIWSGASIFGLSSALLLVSVWGLLKYGPKTFDRNCTSLNEAKAGGFLAAATVSAFAFLLGGLPLGYCALKAAVAPRVVLIEKLKDAVK